MAELVGMFSTERVKPGDKFRVTWKLQLLPLIGTTIIDPVKANNLLLAVLPKAGFAPVHAVTAKPGDLSIVIDVRLSLTWSGSWSGRTAADVVNGLANVSQHAGFVDRLTLNDVKLDRVQSLSLTLSSQELDAGRAAEEKASQKEQEDKDLWKELKAWLQKLAVGAGVGIVIVVVGGITYLYVSRRRG